MKAKIKECKYYLAITPRGEIPLSLAQAKRHGLKDGQEVNGDIIEFEEQMRYENGEYSRDIITYKEFIIVKE